MCQNTKGSFYCQARQRCMEGFLQDPEGNCVGERALQGLWQGGGCGVVVGLREAWPREALVKQNSCSPELLDPG